MSLTDRYGLALSTTSAAAARHYQDGMDRLLSYGYGADQAFAAAGGADEGFALGHAGAALFALFQGDGAAAKAAIERARGLTAGTTRREQQHVAAISTIAGGDGPRGLALIEEHVKEFPRDALLVNQGGSAIGLGGRADREALRVGFVERLADAYGDDWWYHSALGFAYHEVGRYADSRRLSERSLTQYPANANASHNIAHCCYETVDNDGGVALLSDWLDGYDRRAPFHCHLAWHLALFELQRGRPEQSLAIYERDIAPSSNRRLAMIDGSALLWRFGLYDFSYARLSGRSPSPATACSAHDQKGPLPWRHLADLATRVTRPGFIFGDVHAALAYVSAGDQAAMSGLIAGLEALHAKGHPIAGAVALPLVRGVAAYAAGDYAGALALMEPVDGEIHRVGGSHAQWELFEETMVVCLLRLGRLDQAQRLISRRLGRRPTPQDLVWLGRVDRARA
jgi:tetratricopeptide (TPR) repeat protein